MAIAILYFLGLWLRQIFSGPRRDSASELPAPPRALTGHSSLPVYGHTHLFQRLAGSVALLFPPEKRELPLLPDFCSRQLGECFAIYVWGQWRVVIKGPERAKQVLDTIDLKEGFPWTPPVTLLGRSCLPFLEDHDAEQLHQLIRKPLSHSSVIHYAPLFAELAEKCLDDIRIGKFKRSKRKKMSSEHRIDPYRDDVSVGAGSCTDHDDDTSDNSTDFVLKLKWDALRSYTFDLIDGPVLRLNKWFETPEQAEGEPTKEDVVEDKKGDGAKKTADTLPTREKMILYMERIKAGVDTIKITFGPEWMYIWMLNEYGRALNARMHVSEIFTSHVEQMSKTVPVEHKRGHAYQDPTTQPIPLLALRKNMIRDNEGIFGSASIGSKVPVRARSYSAPTSFAFESDGYDSTPEYVSPFSTEQDLARPRYEQSPVATRKKLLAPEAPIGSPSGRKFVQDIEHRPVPPAPKSASKLQKKQELKSVLEYMLRQHDMAGNGVSQVVACDLSISLWMTMDVSNAWTAMALNLLGLNKEACRLVHEEIDSLEEEFGHHALFKPSVLGRMKFVDALLYEAIRLCPAFLGGLKQTTRTIEFQDIGIQLPKNSHIFFCQPTDREFDIHRSVGKKPETLGDQYPCVEL